jgi:predicted dehydrogenase
VTGALRVGLVGCGRIAERGYLPALRRVPGLELAAVADVDPARCAGAAPGAPAFGSAAALLAEAALDALIVATPAETHLEIARLAAAAGLPALVEKPPAADVEQARELAALAPAPWIGFNRRFEPALQRLRAGLPASRLELTLAFSYERASWGSHAASGDVLLDVGPHLLDLARWLGGEVRAVRPRVLEERRAVLEVELERGRAHVACDGAAPYRELVDARDSRGRKLGRYEAGGRVWGVRARLRAGHSLVPSLAAQLRAFAEAARGAPAPILATARDGLAAMEAIGAARAAAVGGTVRT